MPAGTKVCHQWRQTTTPRMLLSILMALLLFGSALGQSASPSLAPVLISAPLPTPDPTPSPIVVDISIPVVTSLPTASNAPTGIASTDPTPAPIVVDISIPVVTPSPSGTPSVTTSNSPTGSGSQSPTSNTPSVAGSSQPTTTPAPTATAIPSALASSQPTSASSFSSVTPSSVTASDAPTHSSSVPTVESMASTSSASATPSAKQLPLDDPSTLSPQYHECLSSASSMNPAVIKGKRFFDSQTGAYIPIKGIAYYPRPNDGPLSTSNSVDFFTDEFKDLWEADIAQFSQLGINTIRIYGVDPSQNHDAFMCELQNVGIYVIFGLLADCGADCSIGPVQAPACYPPLLKTRGQFIINTFSKYRNTLAFSAGNEVAWYAREAGGETAWNAPCQKQFLRDMRSYIHGCSAIANSILPRKVPIGLVTADFDRSLKARYFGCRTDPNDELENAEWYGINSYRHCDPNAVSVDDLTGFLELQQDFLAYQLPVPVVLAEFGCRERFATIGEFEAQRTWLQVDALFRDDYQQVFAGGVVFEYSAEKIIVDTSAQNNPWPYYEFMKLQYGVGYYAPIDCNHQNITCRYNAYPEFELLANRLASIDVSFIPPIGDYNPSLEFPECPVEIEPLSNFTWPSDEEPDLPCYVITTDSPSHEPSSAPSLSPLASSMPTSMASNAPTMTTPSNSPSGTGSQSPTPLLALVGPSTSPTTVASSPPTTRLTDPAMPASDLPSSQPTSVSQAPTQAAARVWSIITSLHLLLAYWMVL